MLDAANKIDQLYASKTKTVYVREVFDAEEDGQVVQKYHRYAIEQGQDISDQPEEVQQFCIGVWG